MMSNELAVQVSTTAHSQYSVVFLFVFESLCNPFASALTSLLISKLEVRQSDHGRAHEKLHALGLLRLGNKGVAVILDLVAESQQS